MSAKTVYENGNGIGSEVVFENPNSNNGNGKTIDVSKLLQENNVSGTFTTTDGKTITITNGQVTNIEV